LGGRVLLAGLAGLALHRLERARRRLEGAVWELSRLEVSLAAGGRRAPGPHLAAAARLLGEGLEELEGLRRLLERLAQEAAGAEVSLGLCREGVEGPQAVVRPGGGGEVVVELCEAGCGGCEEHTMKLKP
jgi:hypothetical protein